MSTISYDEFDNGNAFLFSMPITRKSYTVEKYAFGLIFGMVFWLLATVIALIAGTVRAVAQAAELFHIDLISMFHHLLSMRIEMLIIMLLGLGSIISLLSMGISISILNKKEF